MSDAEGKLSIVVDRVDWCRDANLVSVRVKFNGQEFEVTGRRDGHIIERMVSAAIKSCLNAVPEEPKAVPF
jgi:hypothetical protein